MTGQTALKVDVETIATAIGKSRRKVQQDATAKRWRYDEEVLPTGNRKRVYLVSDLPSKIRSAILDHEVDRVRTAVPAPLESVPQRSRDVADLTAWQREVMEARAAILGWIDDKAAVFGKDGDRPQAGRVEQDRSTARIPAGVGRRRQRQVGTAGRTGEDEAEPGFRLQLVQGAGGTRHRRTGPGAVGTARHEHPGVGARAAGALPPPRKAGPWRTCSATCRTIFRPRSRSRPTTKHGGSSASCRRSRGIAAAWDRKH